MRIEASSPEDYISKMPEERQSAMNELRTTILENLPKGFDEQMTYGMIGYVVPHSIYPAGYHCNPNEPLPFMSIGNQKHFIGFYHMGIYSDAILLDWFVSEFKQRSNLKLDMGKSCVRFKKPDLIPFSLLGELVQKISVKKWIETYEAQIKR